MKLEGFGVSDDLGVIQLQPSSRAILFIPVELFSKKKGRQDKTGLDRMKLKLGRVYDSPVAGGCRTKWPGCARESLS